MTFDHKRNECAIYKEFRAVYGAIAPECRRKLEALIKERVAAGYRVDVINLIYVVTTIMHERTDR